MKNITVTPAQAGQINNNLVVIAEKDTIAQLSACLTPDEMQFLQNSQEHEVRSFFFARPGGCVFVRLLKTDKDENLANEDARLAGAELLREIDRKSTRLNSSHSTLSRMPSSA